MKAMPGGEVNKPNFITRTIAFNCFASTSDCAERVHCWRLIENSVMMKFSFPVGVQEAIVFGGKNNRLLV